LCIVLFSLVTFVDLTSIDNGQTLSAEGMVDVHNDPPLGAVSAQSALNPWNGYLYNSTTVRDSSAFAQPFTPTFPLLTAVDMGLNVYYPEGAYCRIEIRGNSTGPVLAYNEGQLVNGKSYEHFSFHSSAKVNPGDYISGQILYSSYNPLCGSPAYTITTVDGTNGGTTVYSCADKVNTALRRANAGALEVYGVDACNKLPNTSSITFYSVTETPNVGYWINQVYSVSPNCNFNAVYPTLYWNPNA
jgi:hypothetical protein